ncbi:DUF5687 family protein [Ekhidna sp. MALMAid0563]|uniref:DUF5687 family protein n=1 Tax=Ekhidna sp. MALMAid0563 TaxID=3143937 RepID=UPI0032DEB7AC
MDLFYIRHHYQSIVRSTSFDGEIFAFIILSFIFGSSLYYSYESLNIYAEELSRNFAYAEVNYHLFLLAYVFLDMAIRMFFRRPLPKLKYYVLWSDQSKAIAQQYLFTSLFGIMPFVLFISMLVVAAKANEWLGWQGNLTVILWWFANHFIGLNTQFSGKWVKSTLVGGLLFIVAVIYFLPSLDLEVQIMNPILPSIILFAAVLGAYYKVKESIEKREVNDEKKSLGLLDSLPVLSFKNPVFQLEWALLVRNKRTRSNLLLGLVSVLILPFLVDGDTEWMVSTMIFFIATGFFIIQHGVYSLGWEGSYFDFLITNISPKNFIKTRYLFYVGACIVGLVFASIPTIINGLSWVDLIAIFIFNIGVTIPVVLYRSVFNSTRITLTENSFMNYNGMMTGPIFVSSFLVILLPLFLYGLGQAFLGENAVLFLGGLGLLGLALFHLVTDLIAKKYQSRKYHLSQSFKA